MCTYARRHTTYRVPSWARELKGSYKKKGPVSVRIQARRADVASNLPCLSGTPHTQVNKNRVRSGSQQAACIGASLNAARARGKEGTPLYAHSIIVLFVAPARSHPSAMVGHEWQSLGLAMHAGVRGPVPPERWRVRSRRKENIPLTVEAVVGWFTNHENHRHGTWRAAALDRPFVLWVYVSFTRQCGTVQH